MNAITCWVGQSLERLEDATLLTGNGRYIDDMPVRPDTVHAAIFRSPHAHARIRAIETESARKTPGVAAVLTGADVSWSASGQKLNAGP